MKNVFAANVCFVYGFSRAHRLSRFGLVCLVRVETAVIAPHLTLFCLAEPSVEREQVERSSHVESGNLVFDCSARTVYIELKLGKSHFC